MIKIAYGQWFRRQALAIAVSFILTPSILFGVLFITHLAMKPFFVPNGRIEIAAATATNNPEVVVMVAT